MNTLRILFSKLRRFRLRRRVLKNDKKHFQTFNESANYYMNIIDDAFRQNKLEDLIEKHYRSESGLQLFTNSLYSVHIRHWLKYFKRYFNIYFTY